MSMAGPVTGSAAALLDMRGRLVTARFRGERVVVLAEIDDETAAGRPDGPLTDPLHLELLTGLDEAPWWQPPVRLYAVFAYGRVPMTAVARASRWASYAARVAVVPRERVGERVLLEAALRGIWVLGHDTPLPDRGTGTDVLRVAVGDAVVMAAGERGPSRGSQRGLMARLLNEIVWRELITSGRAAPEPRRRAPDGPRTA